MTDDSPRGETSIDEWDQAETWRRLFETPAGWTNGKKESHWAALRTVQSKFNAIRHAAGLRQCDGLNAGRMLRPYQCENPLCPSCWFRTQRALYDLLVSIEAPYWHVRYTNDVFWYDEHHPKVLKRFAANDTDFKVVGYLMVPESTDEVVDNLEVTTCVYRKVGIWTSDRPIRNWAYGVLDESGMRGQGSLFLDKEKTRWVGSVTLESFTNQFQAWERFCELVPHPSHLAAHDAYPEYIDTLRSRLKQAVYLRKTRAKTVSA